MINQTKHIQCIIILHFAFYFLFFLNQNIRRLIFEYLCMYEESKKKREESFG